MKKRKAIWISVTVIAAAIVFGIASLPDEVLLENPIDVSENTPTDPLPTEFQPEILLPDPEPEVVEEPEPEVVEEPEPEVVEEPEPEVIEEPETEPEEESEGNVIEIKISDGIGSGDR